MESGNGENNVFPSIPAADIHTGKILSPFSPPPPCSDLFTKSNLLTREEECTLKTALAFVIIKARAKAKAKARAKASASETTILTNTSKNNPSKKDELADLSADTKNDSMENETDRGIASLSTSSSALSNDDPSILDHLFSYCSSRRRNSGYNQENMLRKPFPSRFLECTEGRDHIDHMFYAAKTLAETLLVAHRNQQPHMRHGDQSLIAIKMASTAIITTNKALVGATGHLARQLQLLLVANQTTNSTNYNSTPTKPSSITQSLLAKRKGKEKRTSRSKVRYRRPSISSKSAADSASSPSSSSRTNPATNQNNNSNSKTGAIEGDETNQVGMAKERLLDVQHWIRSTLLQLGDYRQHTMTTDTANKESKSAITTLSCRNATVYDVLAPFHVYTVMVPQISRISPPLIGHIFQVVAKLVKDLYSDKITVVGGTASVVNGDDGERDIPVTTCYSNARQLIDQLAISALTLLEICWTTKIGGDHSSCGEGHRSFLLLSLQEILGDLLIPLSRSELAGEHYRLTVSASRNRMFQQRKRYSQTNTSRSSESKNHSQTRQQRRLILARRNQFESETSSQGHVFRKSVDDLSSSASVPATPRHVDTTSEKNPASKSQASRKPAPSLQLIPRTGGCLLDPEAKLLLRIAVYRLILMEN